MTTIQEAIAAGSRPINAHVERFEPAQCWYVRVGYHDGRETFGRTYRQKSNAVKECRRVHRLLDRLAAEELAARGTITMVIPNEPFRSWNGR